MLDINFNQIIEMIEVLPRYILALADKLKIYL